MRLRRPGATIAEQTTAPIRKEPIMVRYWYSLTPLVVIGTLIILSAPWLGLIALMVFVLVALAALGALVWGIVLVLQMLTRSVGRRWHSRSGAERPPATLSAARPPVAPAQSMPAGAAVLLASPPSESERST
jgi:hypothetical protein